MDIEDRLINERGLLGSVVIEPKLFDLLSLISGVNFHDKDLGVLFDYGRTLHERGDVIDHLLLYNEYRKKHTTLSSGDIAEVFSYVPNASNAPLYAKKVIDCYIRQQAQGIAARLANDSQDLLQEPEAIVGRTVSAIETLMQTGESHLNSIEACSNEAYRLTFAPKEDDAEPRTIETGINIIDDSCGGLMDGGMYVLAARPGCGKTSMAWQILEHVARNSGHALFASLEMTDHELVNRAVAGKANMDARMLRSGHVPKDKVAAVKDAFSRLAGLPISFFVPPTATIKQIRAAARMQRSQTGLSLIVVDYLGLIKPDGRSRGSYEDVTQHSNELKSLAREMECPVVVLCQLSRKADGVVPELSHLRDSGAIEQDADAVVFLSPENWEESPRERFIVSIGKNRSGPVCRTTLKFEGKRTRFIQDHEPGF